MTKENEDDVDLGLTLGYSTSCIQTKLNNNSGAGVNAGPSVDMTFAASDPLSELVWSPHKGLSLKCATCTKADKKPFLLWNVGPQNLVPPPSQSIRFQESGEEKIVDGNLILADTIFHGQDAANGDKLEERNIEGEILPKHGSQNEGNAVDDDDKECSPRDVQMADMTDGSQRNTGQSKNPFVQGNGNSSHDTPISKSQHGKLNEEFSTNCGNTTNGVAGGSSQILAGVTAASEVGAEIRCSAHTDLLPKTPWQNETANEAILSTKEESKEVINMYCSKLPSSVVVECMAENDLLDLNIGEAYWQSEERLPGGTSVPFGTSPINDNQRRGKNRALDDGNVSKRASNGDDDSHESVESCNSAGLLSKGKRQFRYEENLVFERKRLKQINRSPASMSTAKNDSSFMNWISNMVKGSTKINEDDPSLANVLDPTKSEHAAYIEETLICSDQHDPLSRRNMGFQTIFQSLFSQNTRLIEARVTKDDCSLEESQGILHEVKTNLVNPPIGCTRQNGSSSENVMPVQVDSVAELAENKVSVGLQCHGGRDKIVSSESLGMHMITSFKNENCGFAFEGRQVSDMSDKSNLFGSLWITRLSPKTGTSTLNLDERKQVTCCEAWKHPDHKAFSSQIEKNADLGMKHICSQARDSPNEASGDFLVKELQMFASNTECSVGFKEIHSHKLNPVLPSQTLKRSEAIASIFARRLDALKHIMPSGSKNEATCAEATCFFCGKSGHSLGDCSEVTKSELDHLLRNISSYVGAECPCLCIRCFQLDHWAAACPRGSSSRQQHLEKNTFFSVSNLKLLSIDERASQKQRDKGTICSGEKRCTNINSRNSIINGDSLVQRSLSSNETQKQHAPYSQEKSSEEFHNLHSNSLFSTHVINIPQGIFDAVRRLQVYRADIVKLMGSHVLIPHLEGFFLRLRLGKWEAGLGGTGYYVACITGQAGKAAKDLKKSICVSVGGVRCQVGSQYVSNQDFLEDEFMTWWCRTLRSGGKLPTKDELESKFKQRINLGF